ncbi:hypothetical protein SDC9_188925 [bioreactor metagenome]|uniref:Uncharacterized protein n=1 Tax=bioreactor metagenome TaxID=1076179 RepID=A0A645HT46_9ZZZZ
MTLEFLDGPIFEGLLVHGIGRVGGYDIPSFLKLKGTLQRGHLDFAPDALGPLAPFELDGFDVVLVDDVFGHAEAGILHVHLD